ncbi:hypothetical protein LTR22_005031 [Elasticomyces elasticus]|nr:hypothetical protein LTR22_005031 [Elasticomyces elasticus]KAK4927636.1 hypothetical protein LTR49_005505 [Elasticomyces elasticus]KAK5767008.1 hypothetical protein LTS12_002773 [Elasticomyces elasticus]
MDNKLRLCIYEFVLIRDKPIKISRQRNSPDHKYSGPMCTRHDPKDESPSFFMRVMLDIPHLLAITTVCRQMRQEVDKLFFSCNTFNFERTYMVYLRADAERASETIAKAFTKDYSDFAAVVTLPNVIACKEIQMHPKTIYRPGMPPWGEVADTFVDTVIAQRQHVAALSARNAVGMVTARLHDNQDIAFNRRLRLPLERPQEAILKWVTKLEGEVAVRGKDGKGLHPEKTAHAVEFLRLLATRLQKLQ